MILKFMFSKKATKIDEIFTVDLTLCSKCQIDSEDLVNFCGLLRKHVLYYEWFVQNLEKDCIRTNMHTTVCMRTLSLKLT